MLVYLCQLWTTQVKSIYHVYTDSMKRSKRWHKGEKWKHKETYFLLLSHVKLRTKPQAFGPNHVKDYEFVGSFTSILVILKYDSEDDAKTIPGIVEKKMKLPRLSLFWLVSTDHFATSFFILRL